MPNSNSKVKSQNSKVTSMADLMKKVAAAKTPFVSPHKGDMLTGTITKLTSSEILVDINAKTEAVVLEKDSKILHRLLTTLKAGDRVSVQVLNPESDFGNSVVSLRRFMDDKVWEKLLLLQKSQEAIEVIVDSLTKGGFLVTTLDGEISGFLPNSHTSSLENLQNNPGKTIKVVVLEVNRELRKIIFSQKQVMGISDFQELVRNIKVGQKIDAIITTVASFGIFLSIPLKEEPEKNKTGKFVEGFVHISEVSWENISDLSEKFKVGERITAEVKGFDKDSRRVNLSIKSLATDPFEKRLEEFTPDKKIKAKVLKIISTGVLMDIGEGIIGIVKKEKIPPTITYKEGESADVVVAGVDKKKHRINLVPVLLEKPIGYR